MRGGRAIPPRRRQVDSLTLIFAIAARLTKALQDPVSPVSRSVSVPHYCDGIRHTLQLSYARFEDQRSGETLGRLHKVRTDVENLVRTAINRVFTGLISVVFVTAYIVTIHWTIVAILVVAVPMLGLLNSVLTRRVKKVQSVIVAEMAGLAGSATETLRNVEIVKSLGLVDQEIARLVAGCASVVRLELRKAARRARSTSCTERPWSACG
jgi:ATP-binding cassette subfamily B protein